MAYIGNTPADGEFKKADAISSTFNGVLTQFNIDYGTIQQSIGDPSQLIVSLNGVIQEPLTAYTLGIGGGSIIFASAPVSGDTCHIVILGGVGGTITPSDNSVTASKLSPSLKDFLEQNFVANGSQTTYTLSRAATGANTLLLSIDGILQPSSAFSVSGTTLTIDPALPNTTNVRVVHLGVVAGVYVPAANSVTADMIANSINTDIATGVTANTTANAALPKAGGAMTGPITTNSTFDGVDIGVRDGILTSTTTTANAALPKAGGTMTGVIAGFTSTGIDDNATSTAITIDQYEQVGVGVTPEYWNNTYRQALQIGHSVSLSAHKSTNILVLANNAYYDGNNTRWEYINSTEEAAQIEMTTGGAITLDVAAAGTEDTAITWNTGFEVLNDGKARAPNGLLFGTDTAAANALDDYEEGYYDPSVSAYGTSGAFGFASASNTLAYTKIGRTVHVQGYISITDMSGTDTGHLIMSLPFTAATLNDDSGYCFSSVVLQNHGGSITGNVYLFIIGSTAYFYKVQTDGSAGYIMVQHVDTTFQIGVNFTYLAA